jgi:hypothetical protein
MKFPAAHLAHGDVPSHLVYLALNECGMRLRTFAFLMRHRSQALDTLELTDMLSLGTLCLHIGGQEGELAKAILLAVARIDVRQRNRL